MRIATWNVNSLKARLPRVEAWIAEAAPDVLCIQETKLTDAKFPAEAFTALGYEAVHHGQGQWNGVAIISRVGIDDVTTGFGALPDPYEGEARLVAARCGGIRFVDVYVPNGREVDTDHYVRKLEWLATLRTWLQDTAAPADPLVLLGDFNVAPEDRDVWSIDAFAGLTHVTAPERAAIASLCDWGLVDAFRAHDDSDGKFSFWDYRNGDFHKGRGMRIDYLLVTEPVAARVESVMIDRDARKGEKPSDHAPVVVDLRD